ncbi:MAG TPA: hypothetical protein VFQ54_04725, partial [Thermomicrobiales bacterium]|nr:hypothetical protein [Thermomicrobiales bacterium]
HRSLRPLPGRRGVIPACIALLLGMSTLFLMLPSPAAARDILDPVSPTSTAFSSQPTNVLSSDDAGTLYRLVLEARSFGIPLSIRIQSVPSQQEQSSTQSAAQTLYTDQPVESSSGADDGILLLVQIPSNDKTLSTAAYAVGKNFYPQGGITPDVLDQTINQYMYPRFKTSTIGSSVINGVTWLVYDQLFLTTPRIPKTHGENSLARITAWVMTPILVILGILFIGSGFLALRRTRRYRPETPPAPINSPFVAGAIGRGRVDDAVITAGMLALIDRGSLREVRQPARPSTWRVSDDVDPVDPFLQRLWQRAREVAQPETRMIDDATLGQFRDLATDARKWQEGYLATNGYFHPRARLHNLWLLVAGILLLVIAAYALIPSFIARERAGIFGAIALTVMVVGTVWWSRGRSFTTAFGAEALDAWTNQRTAATYQGDPTGTSDLETLAVIVDQQKLIRDGRWLRQRYGDGARQAMGTVLGMGPS